MSPLNQQLIAATNTAERAKILASASWSVYVSYFSLLEVIGILATIAFIAGTLYIIDKTNWFRNHMDRLQGTVLKTDISKKRAERAWENAEKHFFAGNDNDLKVALLEADKILDDALRNAGIIGTNIGDRLKKIKPEQLPNIDDVWQAHKLRNQLAHESDFVLKRDLAERALGIYKKALESLGAIEEEGK